MVDATRNVDAGTDTDPHTNSAYANEAAVLRVTPRITDRASGNISVCGACIASDAIEVSRSACVSDHKRDATGGAEASCPTRAYHLCNLLLGLFSVAALARRYFGSVSQTFCTRAIRGAINDSN